MPEDKIMTKVCMITTAHSPLDNRIFYKEATSLKNRGYDVSVIGHTPTRTMKTVNGIETVGLEKGTGLKSNPILWRDLAREASKIDAEIYHCHEPESFLVALYIKLFKGKKIIYDVHEYYDDVVSLASPPMRIFLLFMLYVVEPLFCRYADAIITADDGIAKRYIKFNKNVSVIFNFPTEDIFKACVPDDGRYSGRFVVIYVGGLNEERGILELIKAVHHASEKQPQIKLLLIGDFRSKEFQSTCEDYVRNHKIEDNVEFVGFVPHKDIPKYISASNVGTALFHATKRFVKTAYPIKLFEYMICGKPVIVSDLPAIRRVIEECKCGLLVNPMNTNETADAIVYLLEHPDEAKLMGDSGKEAIQDKYNWSRMEDILLKVYQKISA